MRVDSRWPLLAVGVLGLLVSVRMAAAPLARVRLAQVERAASRQATDSQRGVAAESIGFIASRDLFRIGRRPILPAYDPMRLGEQQAPPPPRPVLTLVGIVDGAEPSAVVEGLPGVDGSRVVRVGDVVGGLRIKRIAAGRVVVVGADTTWALEVREPWKQ